MNISKKQFYAFQFLLVIYYYFKFFSFISSESIWYDDAHELLISKINLFDIEDLIGIADYHIGFSLLLLLITYVTDFQYIYFLISILFFFPIAVEVVAHSPTPSAVNIKASSKGDGKKALAA